MCYLTFAFSTPIDRKNSDFNKIKAFVATLSIKKLKYIQIGTTLRAIDTGLLSQKYYFKFVITLLEIDKILKK